MRDALAAALANVARATLRGSESACLRECVPTAAIPFSGSRSLWRCRCPLRAQASLNLCLHHTGLGVVPAADDTRNVSEVDPPSRGTVVPRLEALCGLEDRVPIKHVQSTADALERRSPAKVGRFFLAKRLVEGSL